MRSFPRVFLLSIDPAGITGVGESEPWHHNLLW